MVEVAQALREFHGHGSVLRKTRRRKTVMLDRQLWITELLVALGKLYPDREIRRVGHQFFAKGAGEIVAIAGVHGIADLPLHSLGDGRNGNAIAHGSLFRYAAGEDHRDT